MGVLCVKGYYQKQINEIKACIAKYRERDICIYTNFPDSSGSPFTPKVLPLIFLSLWF